MNAEKLELGGGLKPRGEGFVNLDILPCADVVFDLDTIPPGRLPFEDASLAEVYSSHCLEHVKDPFAVLREVARVCREGAPVEVRVPHPVSDLAMVPGHRHVIGPIAVLNVCHYFRAEYWPPAGCPRRLELVREAYGRSVLFDEVRALFAGWTEEQVLRFAPRACHEVIFHFRVVPNV